MASTWKAVLRAAVANDAEGVLAFYEANPSKHVLGRADSVRSACADGRQFLIELDGEVIAVAGWFPVAETRFVEIGGTRVADAWPGFRLQVPLLWARFASVVLTEDRDVQITTAVDPGNEASRKNVEAAGFEAWMEPIPDLLTECDPGQGRKGCPKKLDGLPMGEKCCSRFYLLPGHASRQAVRDLLKATSGGAPLSRLRKDGSAIELQILCTSVTNPSRREDLEAFCDSR